MCHLYFLDEETKGTIWWNSVSKIGAFSCVSLNMSLWDSQICEIN